MKKQNKKDGLPQSRQVEASRSLSAKQRVKKKKKRKVKGEKKEGESPIFRPESASLGLGGRRPSISHSSRGIRCPLLGGRGVVVVSGGAVARSTRWCVSPVVVVGRRRSVKAKHPVVQFSGWGRGPLLDNKFLSRPVRTLMIRGWKSGHTHHRNLKPNWAGHSVCQRTILAFLEGWCGCRSHFLY